MGTNVERWRRFIIGSWNLQGCCNWYDVQQDTEQGLVEQELFFWTTTVLLITTSYTNKLPPVARCNATNILQHHYKTNPQSPNVTTKNSNLTECNDLSIQPLNVELEVVPITDKLSSNLVCRIGLDLKRFGFQFHSNLMFGSNDWLNSKSQGMKSHKHRISKSYQGGWYFVGFHSICV